ncbi:amidohydrolase family protein [Pseudoalteromonas fenneropenaei]|uniref:Amidohydrolase family protein n=1 Tax=Pseudoalteromonas fenneropenaei TaxID=1737459 RepID=A0ABV7CJF9_9GAMM
MAELNLTSATFDTLIVGAKIYDGTGGHPFVADVAIVAERIVAIGDLSALATAQFSRTVVEAHGLCLAPGFIDVHTHDDLEVFRAPDMAAKITQGVTTVIAGNCGISAAPATLSGEAPDPMNLLGADTEFQFSSVAGYRARFERAPANVNVALLVGHTTLRNNHMADLSLPATAAQIAAMQTQLADALRDGAIGLSTGLAYGNANAAPTSEVSALCEVVKQYDGIYTTHLRTEFDGVLEAMDEAFSLASQHQLPLVISHLKCAGKQNWGRAPELLAALSAYGQHHQCSCDAYPYAASSSTLDLKQVTDDFTIFITWSQPYPDMAGMTLKEIAAVWQTSLLDAATRLQPAGAVYHGLHEQDVQTILGFEKTMIGSDGLPCDPHPHPRLWGSFPRVLGRYSRELGLLSLPQAIHKMTGLSARNFALKGRGEVRTGNYADLVLFDDKTINDSADFVNSSLPAKGIHQVWVNGVMTFTQQQVLCARAGQFLAATGATKHD